MTQVNKAKQFAEIHTKGDPLLLFNAWDAGSARAIWRAGAKAIATSSWSMAEAHGYRDGEAMPLKLVEQIVERIVATVDVPVSVDFESGYMHQPASPHDKGEDDTLAENIGRLLDLGIVGVNFEDRVAGETGMYGIDRQVRRIAVLRRVADQKGVPLFINARTDLFLGRGGDPAKSIGEALDRGKAYAAAGASGFFVPGLLDEPSIARICDSVSLPVNIMQDGMSSNGRWAGLGVARISYGATPYINAMKTLENQAGSALRP
ncbi:isocitrate lyase/PEP mutase family protein [Nannocystis punicea]|uniref:Isocitrate lyase/phosphoenolpyruvate mutase family protein n=1 Tax=Nannocystis punicea TaxID=2995304 RepID=A0ABY7GUJ9_9BACT|nr:isocitrate lyase/phosphoenolpyruvate mutase family protein [Nannocystis poenicansa]WAS90644.1 isocitrate lyase/phosphoenolpyruvate mutase family protein [Nannocystis poenicansa]